LKVGREEVKEPRRELLPKEGDVWFD
jgi:hypothetical protein